MTDKLTEKVARAMEAKYHWDMKGPCAEMDGGPDKCWRSMVGFARAAIRTVRAHDKGGEEEEEHRGWCATEDDKNGCDCDLGAARRKKDKGGKKNRDTERWTRSCRATCHWMHRSKCALRAPHNGDHHCGWHSFPKSKRKSRRAG